MAGRLEGIPIMHLHWLRGAQLLVAIIILVVVATGAHPGALNASAQQQPRSAGSRTIMLAPSDENFPNPERGLHGLMQSFRPGAGPRDFPLTNFASLLRQERVTLVHLPYLLDQFLDAPLSPAALEAINQEFRTVRDEGLKVIPRFSYTWPTEFHPLDYPEPQADFDRVLGHIDQLAQVLRTNGDVIAFMEVGFVGPWGEWHHSTTGLVNPDWTTNERSAQIVERVLWALPDTRAAALRMPYHKQQMFGMAPLTDEQAFNKSNQARIGAHNDCFLENETDGNTYYRPDGKPPLPSIIEAQKAYLNQDNRFVPQSGESCGADERARPFIQCDNALRELARMHWSTLNRVSHPDVIRLWKEQGCFSEIQRRLGYRFRLISAELPNEARVGEPITVTFTITNDGWAAPYNPRAALVVFRHAVSGRVFTLDVPYDVRRWGPGEVITVPVSGRVPAAAELGEYQVLLNFPDPEPTLYTRPEYSIRLANEGVWETRTGSNVLPARITIGR
jgi:hypothetical protein